jgi:hypothetical protein
MHVDIKFRLLANNTASAIVNTTLFINTVTRRKGIVFSNESWYRIVSATAPWMATANAFQCQPKSFEGPVFFKRFQCVLATGRRIPAFGPKPWANDELIKSNEQYKRKSKCSFPKGWLVRFWRVGQGVFAATFHGSSSNILRSLLRQ